MSLSPEFWAVEREELLAVLLPRLEQLTITGADAVMDDLALLGLSFDPALVNQQAVAWAREHLDELLQQLGTTTENVVGEILANWLETPGANIGQLSRSLLRVLDGDERRMNLIAVTETTRAYAEGTDLAYQEAGFPAIAFNAPAHPDCRCWTVARQLSSGEWVVVWQTNHDEIVCKFPIETPWGVAAGCGALHDVIVSEGEWMGRKFSEAVAASE